MTDLRFAIRQLVKNPGFSAIAAFTLALGIGLVTTQFSLIDGVLLRGLPIRDAQRLVHVSRLNPQSLDPGSWEGTPCRDYFAFREQQSALESLAAVNPIGANLSGPGRIPSH